jgi:hypothetical protein
MNKIPHVIPGTLNEAYIMGFDSNIAEGLVETIVNRAIEGDYECIEFILNQMNITQLLPAYELKWGKLEPTLMMITGYTMNTETENKKEK